MVEHSLGKGKVESSILFDGTINKKALFHISIVFIFLNWWELETHKKQYLVGKKTRSRRKDGMTIER